MKYFLPRQGDRHIIMLVPPLVVAALAVVVSILIWVNPPALRYSSDRYIPAHATVCPGDRLEYAVALEVRRAPLTALLVRVWWSIDRDEPMMLAPDQRSIWLKSLPMTTHNLSLTVPALPPGEYELREAREQFRDTTTPAYAVAFTIPEGCRWRP